MAPNRAKARPKIFSFTLSYVLSLSLLSGGFGMKEMGVPYYGGYSGLGQDKVCL